MSDEYDNTFPTNMPETRAEAWHYTDDAGDKGFNAVWLVSASFAERLERELAAADSQLLAHEEEHRRLTGINVGLVRDFNAMLQENVRLSNSLSDGTNALAEMEARKDGAYEERNRVVAALAWMAVAAGWKAGWARTAIEGWSEDWHGCLYIDLPSGQVSWHYHDSHAHLFSGLPRYEGSWDGHDTPTKYERVVALASHCQSRSIYADSLREALEAVLEGYVPGEWREHHAEKPHREGCPLCMARAALAKNPIPAGPSLQAEASEALGAEASGTGRDGTREATRYCKHCQLPIEDIGDEARCPLNPNPSGHFAIEASVTRAAEASAPVGLGPHHEKCSLPSDQSGGPAFKAPNSQIVARCEWCDNGSGWCTSTTAPKPYPCFRCNPTGEPTK